VNRPLTVVAAHAVWWAVTRSLLVVIEQEST